MILFFAPAFTPACGRADVEPLTGRDGSAAEAGPPGDAGPPADAGPPGDAGPPADADTPPLACNLGFEAVSIEAPSGPGAPSFDVDGDAYVTRSRPLELVFDTGRTFSATLTPDLRLPAMTRVRARVQLQSPWWQNAMVVVTTTAGKLLGAVWATADAGWLAALPAPISASYAVDSCAPAISDRACGPILSQSLTVGTSAPDRHVVAAGTSVNSASFVFTNGPSLAYPGPVPCTDTPEAFYYGAIVSTVR
jgi:hypothetical protein